MKQKLKLLLIGLLLIQNISSQFFYSVPNPNGIVFNGSSIIYKGSIYFQSQNQTNSKVYLAKYDGKQISIILNPDGGQGYDLYSTNVVQPIIYKDNLIYGYLDSSSKRRLAVFNGDSVKLVPNPDGAFGCSAFPVVFNDKLYFQYIDSSYNYRMAQFDGDSIKLLSIIGYQGYPIVVNNNLYFQYWGNCHSGLGKFDGVNVSCVSLPYDTGYFSSPMITMNNNLYFQTSNHSLAKYNDTTFVIFPKPDNGYGYYNSANPIVFNNNLYFEYQNISNKIQLAKCDGKEITLLSNPTPNGNFSASEWGDLPSIVYKNNLYIAYDTGSVKMGIYSPYNQLAKCDGNTISLIKKPDNGFGYLSSPFIYQDSLYWSYGYNGEDNAVYKFTSDSLILIKNNKLGKWGNPIIYNNGLYIAAGSITHSLYLYFDFKGPNVQASNLKFSQVTDTSFTIICTKGNGNKRAFFAKEILTTQDSTDIFPSVDFSNYSANTEVGNGNSMIDGWMCMYKGTDSVVSIGRLNPGTNYIVMVCEYTDSLGFGKCLTVKAINNPGIQKTLKGYQTITFAPFSQHYSTDKDFQFFAIASSYLPITFSSSDTTIAKEYNGKDFYGNTAYFIHIKKSGTCIFYADQPGNDQYYPALQKSQLLTILAGSDILNETESSLQLYPNPVISNLNIATINNNLQSVKIYDTYGKLVYNNKMQGNNVIDMQQFAPGIYILKINNTAYKIIKE